MGVVTEENVRPRIPLRDDQVAQILAEGNDSEIEEFADDEEDIVAKVLDHLEDSGSGSGDESSEVDEARPPIPTPSRSRGSTQGRSGRSGRKTSRGLTSVREGLGVRHTQTLLLFLAMLLAFTMRVNMSMAIVDMTDETHPGHFEWSHATQSVILSSFFWGYVVLQIPGGELAKRVGGKVLLLVSIGVNSFLSVLMPHGAGLGGWVLVCVCRVLQGLTQAFVYPSMHHLVSQWIPIEEKGLLATIIYAGGQLGIALQLIASGYLASAFGWPWIFYANGILGAIWTVAYLTLGSASPEQSKLISKEELMYIQKSLGRVGEQKRYSTPWRSIVTSLPFWAVIVAHCGQNWGFFTLMTEMPTYMAKVLGVNLKSNGVLSSLPYLAMYALSFPMGGLTDLIIRRNWLSVSNTRKLFNSIGLWGPAIALIGLSYTPEGNMTLAVVMLTLTVGINAGQYTGYMLVHIDLAPNFSSSLMGITNFLANIISIIAPLVCGAIIKDETNPHDWRMVFFVASGVYFFTNLFFVLVGTSERQPWNEPKITHADIEIPEKESKVASPPQQIYHMNITTNQPGPNEMGKTT